MTPTRNKALVVAADGIIRKTGEKNTVETILTAKEAKKYTLKKVFPNWQPTKVIRQVEKKAKKLKEKAF